ncbi:PSMD1, partial [Cervus elaphus hippelaphus]
MLGSKNAQAIEDMVGYAQETQHEKILRGLAVGIALVMYGRMEEADALIESLCRDKDPILRRSGMYTVAMAYCGSGNNKAIRRLLHVAVIGIALVMYGRMEEADALIESLCRDKDPILRRSGMYTVAMAYCGSGNNKAIRRLLHV